MYFILLFPLALYAHVIQDDVTITSRDNFSFKAVCAKMVSHESPLIETVSGTEIDCMGKKVKATHFCDKQMAADPYYLRGFVDETKKEIICESGKKVIFKYLCVKLTDRELCGSDAKESCKIVKDKLAKRLDNVHASFTKNEKGIKQLNCYFESLPLDIYGPVPKTFR
jgi:hypothetical protein